MSVVSSVLSTRSSGLRVNFRFGPLMDSIFTIAFGLGLRCVVDAASHQNFKLTGSLVGLWEGVIMLHFTKKMPKSTDPYIGYAVRLSIDFLFTESFARLALVLIWTALGMVLADITPALWQDVGLNRYWRHLRRDLYTMLQMIPTVAFFPPPRTVRFSPSREHSTIPDAPTDAPSVISPSIVTTEQTPVTNIDVPPTTAAREPLKRRVPGYFPGEYTDTETELGSSRGTPGRTSRRLSVYPTRRDPNDTASSISSVDQDDDLDADNASSGSLSDATEKGDLSSAVLDITQLTEILPEEDLLVDTAAAPVKPEEGELTPKQRQPIYMPPTPSDSAPRWRMNRDIDEPLPVRPQSASLPQIPDFLEENNTEDWEKIGREDYTDEKPPTPPAKDRPFSPKAQVPIISTPVVPPAKRTPSPDDVMKDWDTLDSQILSRPDGNEDATNTDDTRRESQPPPYESNEANHDDIYDDAPASHDLNDSNLTPNLIDISDDVPPLATEHSTHATQGFPNPWNATFSNTEQLEAQRRQEEENAKLREEKERKEEEERKAEEEATRLKEEEELRKKEEEEAAKKKEEEEIERLKEETKRKKAEEKAERARKEAADEAARQKKREEDEAAEKLRKEAEAAEAKRLKDAADAEARREEAEKKKLEEDLERKRVEEQKAKEEEERKEAEAKEKRRKEEEKLKGEEERKQKEEDARKEREEEERKKAERKEEEEAEERRLEKEKEQEQEEAKAAAAAAAAALQETPNDPSHEEPNQLSQEEPLENPLSSDPHAVQVDDPAQLDPPSVEPDPVEEESVASEASEISDKVRDRLEKLLLLKAQLAEMENQVNDLKGKLENANGEDKAQVEQELRAKEKIIKKMQSKAQRRRDEVPKPQFLDDWNDSPDLISMDALGPRDTETKLEEKLEELLTPGKKSLKLQIKVPVGKNGGKQMPNVNKTLVSYGLLGYTTANKNNNRHLTINIPEVKFGAWLATYRMSVTRDEDEDSPAHQLLSDATERGELSSAVLDITHIREILPEEDLLVGTAVVPVKPEEGELTPKQRQLLYMPPTPSDSVARWRINRDIDDPLPIRPQSEHLSQIPDFLENDTEDWEKIQREDYTDEKPPTPPAKDRPSGPKVQVPIISTPVVPPAKRTPSPDDDMKGWDTLDSQIISRPDGNEDATNIDDTRRESQPLPYESHEINHDLYDDPPVSRGVNDFNLNDNIFDDPPVSHSANGSNLTRSLVDMDPPAPHADGTAQEDQEGSVASGASEIPDKVRDRLERLLLLKAQLAEMENHVDDLKCHLENASGEGKAQLEQELRSKEKIVRKMQRKEQRRHAEVPEPKFFDGLNDSPDLISMGALTPRETETKLEEKLEELLTPGKKSLNLQIKVPTGKGGMKQMQNVNKTLDRYCLFEHTAAYKGGKRHMVIDIPDVKFGDWLATYRMSVIRDEDEDSPGHR